MFVSSLLSFLSRYTIALNDISYGCHVRVHIFNITISDEHTKSLGITTEYTLIAVARLGKGFGA
jgi:hypothetical protein